MKTIDRSCRLIAILCFSTAGVLASACLAAAQSSSGLPGTTSMQPPAAPSGPAAGAALPGGSNGTNGGVASSPIPPTASSAFNAASVPDSFRKIRLGMSLKAVEKALEQDPYFNYQGPPDVSMLASPDENLIETGGYSFISRAFFQFYNKKLYIMILMLNPSEISYYTMYTTLTDKYGPSTSLSPGEVVWESKKYRLSLERPLSVKYIDRSVFDSLKAAGKMKQSALSASREQFLNQF